MAVFALEMHADLNDEENVSPRVSRNTADKYEGPINVKPLIFNSGSTMVRM